MLIKDVLDFLFPRYCVLCNKRLTTQEAFLCLPCYIHLPRTDYHKAEHSDMEKLFWGWNNALPIERAVALFHYNTQDKEILLQLKYKDNPEIGTHIASLYAKEIKSSGFFDDIDVIVPVPLHWIRRIKRGYNQSHFVAKGISQQTGILVCKTAVKRIRNNQSQTRMMRSERHDNVANIFRLIHPEQIAGKHILLVDDVTTTGSTLSSCMREMAKAQGIKISVLTLAMAGQTIIPQSEGEELPYISISKEQIRKL